jgi:preprotein translocase subunit SecE
MSAKAKNSQAQASSLQQDKKSKAVDKKAEKAAAKKKEQTKGKNGRKASAKKPNIFVRFFNYLHAVRVELKRVSWPTGREVRNQTITVLVALVFFGLLIYLVDSGINPLLLAYSKLLG